MKPLRMAVKLVGMGILSCGLLACAKKPVVGVLLPTTGEASTYAESMKKAIDLALDEAKAEKKKGTQGLVVLWGDSGTNPEKAAAEYQRLASEGAKIIIAGVTSGEAKALLPVIEKTDVLCLTPSASLPSLTKESKLFYRLFASDELEGRRAGRFLREDQDKESVLIFSEDSEQARGIEPPFRQVFEQNLQGKVVGRVVLTSPTWRQEAVDLLTVHRPQSVYIVAYAEKTLEVLRLLRERHYEGTICVTSAFYSGDPINRYPELTDGVFFPQPAFDVLDESDLVRHFVTAFRERYNQDPDIYAAHAYDALRVVIEVFAETKILETAELRKTLQFGLEEYPGVTGTIQFDDYGDVRHNPIIFIVKDGQIRNHERWVKEQKKLIAKKLKELLSQ